MGVKSVQIYVAEQPLPLSDSYPAKPETFEYVKAIFKEAFKEQGISATILDRPQNQTPQYGLAVTEHLSTGGAGRLFPQDTTALYKQMLPQVDHQYLVRILRRSALGLMNGVDVMNPRESNIYYGEVAEDDPNTICFYFKDSNGFGPLDSKRPPFDCVVLLRPSEESSPSDSTMISIFKRLVSDDFAAKFNPDFTLRSNPADQASPAPIPATEGKSWKTVGIVLGVLAGVAAVIGVLAALVFFGVPVIAAFVAGTTLAAAAGPIAIGAAITTALLGVGCLIACTR